MDRITATSARGWFRPDGLPFADEITELTNSSSQVFYPPIIDETGANIGGHITVVTGTNGTGQKSGSGTYCGDYTADEGSVMAGTSDGGSVIWTLSGNASCSDPARLYCFGTDYSTDAAPAAPTGRLAFVTSTSFAPGGGISAADAVCASDATAAGLSGTFLAVLATSTESAASRFSSTGGSWFRPDGVKIAETADSLLVNNELIASINQSAGGTYLGNSAAWTGFTDISAGGSGSTCVSWGDGTSGNSGIWGTVARSSSTWCNSSTMGCHMTFAKVYCLQQED